MFNILYTLLHKMLGAGGLINCIHPSMHAWVDAEGIGALKLSPDLLNLVIPGAFWYQDVWMLCSHPEQLPG